MKKSLFLLVIILCTTLSFSQKMITRTGEIKFEASMPALEEVAATNNTASCIFDEATGDFVTLALVKAFKFKVPLMEEHKIITNKNRLFFILNIIDLYIQLLTIF